MEEERHYYEAFGLTPPEDEPAQGAPAAEEAAEDGKEPEVVEPEGAAAEQAEPEEPDSPEAGEGENRGEDADPPESGEKPAQSKEERARQAAARRKAEREEAVAQARQEERDRLNEELKELFGWAGFKNGASPIESLEDLRKYRRDTESAQLEKDLKAGRLTPEALQGMVRAELERQKPAEPDPGQAQAFEARVEAELEEIRKYDPEIRSIEDFRNLDRADDFFRQVREHGHTFAEAYRYVYADRIAEANAQRAAKAEAQRARNNIRSKDHMRPAGARGAGDVPVPPETMDMYRKIMPNASDEEIRKHYQKYAK